MNAALTHTCNGNTGMPCGNRKCSGRAADENINAVALSPLKRRIRFSRRFNIAGRWTAAFLTSGFPISFYHPLKKCTVIVINSVSFHSKKRLFSAAQNARCRLLFPPPYSPKLNPIKNFWVWLKRALRKILPTRLLMPLFNCGDYIMCHLLQNINL